MIQLMKKKLFPEKMEVIYHQEFTEEMLTKDFEIKGGNWYVLNGWLTGENRENNAGMIISKQDYFGDIMLEFDARTVLPCTHDINVMWHGSWKEENNTRSVAYVAGLQGWWDGKIGFEKSPDYTLNVGTQLFEFVPGQVYHVQVGSIHGHIFVVIDGKLALEITDPNPIDSMKYGKIGFEAYASKIQFRNFSIKKITYQSDEKSYVPEF